jgi:hypothetical protein
MFSATTLFLVFGQKIFLNLPTSAKIKLGRQRNIVLLCREISYLLLDSIQGRTLMEGSEEVLRHIKTSKQVVSTIVIGITFVMGFILNAPSYARYFTGVSMALILLAAYIVKTCSRGRAIAAFRVGNSKALQVLIEDLQKERDAATSSQEQQFLDRMVSKINIRINSYERESNKMRAVIS